jgi:hypothetical protein
MPPSHYPRQQRVILSIALEIEHEALIGRRWIIKPQASTASANVDDQRMAGLN